MRYIIDGKEYEVVIEKKNNKNTYIRVKEDMHILVTTGYFTTKRQIIDILDRNEQSLRRMLYNAQRKVEKQKFFYYLGKRYDIIIMPGEVQIDGDYIYTENMNMLDKWYKKQAQVLFLEHLNLKYRLFEEKIPYPTLKIRRMKTRWGVCNRRDNSVTLNLDLLKYDTEALDYVIVHELSHFVHFNHSSSFWNLVEKYTPDYKRIKKVLKDG